ESDQLSRLTKAEHVHRIADLQRTLHTFQLRLPLTSAHWLRNRMHLFFQPTCRLACFTQALSRDTRAIGIDLDLCQLRLHLFQLTPRLSTRLVENPHTLLFQTMTFLFELFALVFRLYSLHVEVVTLILNSLTLGLQPFEQVLHSHARAAQEFTGL